MPRLRRVGMYGGTFDPIHRGHIQVASRVRAELGLDSVLLVPAGNPVHRPPAIASREQRVEMVRLAIREEDGLQLDTCEAFSAEPSYTFDTLTSFRLQHPAASWHLIIGADAFLSLPSWKNWRQLFSLAHIVVTTRPRCHLHEVNMSETLKAEWRKRRVEHPGQLVETTEGAICCVDLQTDDVSSSQARDLIKTGADTKSILHPAVAGYIAQQHLYSSGGFA